ncbi:MAG TPA: DUF1844 domain-containing protein [Candidatus Acidoferrales bacterium]|nr:DUF1844 domain-containing protein [Candidatus Acidoferrales bacterium]
MAEPKQDEGFKVVDRRHFTESGDLREGAVEQERREEEAAATKAASAKAAAKAASADVPAPRGAEPPAGEAPGETSESSRSFQTLVDFLTRNAAAMMGGMPDPQTGQAYVDLEGAREVIDMLDALRDKTRGNLSKADQDLLIEVVGSLKLTFMEISKAATEAMAKKNAKR